MKSKLSCLVLATLALSACKKDDPGGETASRSEMVEPSGSYEIDPESGEVRASHTDEAGTTTTMQAGQSVPPVLPAPFATYPGSEITGTTRVERGNNVFVTLDFTTSDTRKKLVEYYRNQALSAGIDPEIDISSDRTTTLAGESADGAKSLILSATRKGEITYAQLTVANGFD